MRLSKRFVQASWWLELVLAHWWVELALVTLVGRAMSRVVFTGQLCTQEDFKQPDC